MSLTKRYQPIGFDSTYLIRVLKRLVILNDLTILYSDLEEHRQKRWYTSLSGVLLLFSCISFCSLTLLQGPPSSLTY